MYLLDTVAISDSAKRAMHAGIRDFLTTTLSHQLFVSVVTIGELHFGMNLLPQGQRREDIRDWTLGVEERYQGRILAVDEAVSKVWGSVRAETKSRGFTIPVSDLLIAATALHHDLTVVTHNVKDFTPTGCKILNPWGTELD